MITGRSTRLAHEDSVSLTCHTARHATLGRITEQRAHQYQPDEQSQDLHARISERAYALYEEHGREDGDAFEDWLEAEQRVLNED